MFAPFFTLLLHRLVLVSCSVAAPMIFLELCCESLSKGERAAFSSLSGPFPGCYTLEEREREPLVDCRVWLTRSRVISIDFDDAESLSETLDDTLATPHQTSDE